jgi:arsenite methyltransferase
VAVDVRYGVDGWPYLAALSGAVGALGLVSVVCARRRPAAATVFGLAAAAAAVPSTLGWYYVLRGKHAIRDRLLDEVAWTGDEVVADFGAGAGLLTVGAARRTLGPVHAVDLFISRDLSSNSADRLRQNATREGVGDRVVVHVRDVRDTGLLTASVEVVLSTLCLHNLAEPAARRAALDEAVRVLRPGGIVAMSDLAHVDDEYAPHLRSRGLTIIRTGPVRGTFPRQRLLVARKP